MHASALCAYLVVFDDLQYLRDLWTQWTPYQDVFRAPGNSCDVVLIISDLIWPILTFCNVFILFLMFTCFYLTYRYIDRLSMHSRYLSIPMECASNHFWPYPAFCCFLFIFTVIYIPIFWLFIASVDCAIPIASDSGPYRLLVISDPSDAISTSLRSFLLIFYLPLPF